MITVAFWNVFKKASVLPHLACLGAAHSVDVFLLAECPKDLTPALNALGGLGQGVWREETNLGSKVRALTRLLPAQFVHRFTGLAGDVAGWAVRAPKLTPAAEVLLAGVHLASKVGGLNEADQGGIAEEVIREINEAEDYENHRNTVVVGDFNMYPYDAGMTSVTGFHGLMTRRLAEQPDRIYRKVPRRRFYNPMWGLLGDRTPGPAGSYRWDSSVPHNPHWGMLDQVLLRTAVIDSLRYLGVLGHDGTHTLLDTDGFPDREGMSDHLPVLFRLDV